MIEPNSLKKVIETLAYATKTVTDTEMSRLMGKPTICICENKGVVTAKLISAFVFATRIVQSLYFLITKFHASSCFL